MMTLFGAPSFEHSALSSASGVESSCRAAALQRQVSETQSSPAALIGDDLSAQGAALPKLGTSWSEASPFSFVEPLSTAADDYFADLIPSPSRTASTCLPVEVGTDQVVASLSPSGSEASIVRSVSGKVVDGLRTLLRAKSQVEGLPSCQQLRQMARNKSCPALSAHTEDDNGAVIALTRHISITSSEANYDGAEAVLAVAV